LPLRSSQAGKASTVETFLRVSRTFSQSPFQELIEDETDTNKHGDSKPVLSEDSEIDGPASIEGNPPREAVEEVDPVRRRHDESWMCAECARSEPIPDRSTPRDNESPLTGPSREYQ